jgi:hypothetical protein
MDLEGHGQIIGHMNAAGETGGCHGANALNFSIVLPIYEIRACDRTLSLVLVVATKPYDNSIERLSREAMVADLLTNATVALLHILFG